MHVPRGPGAEAVGHTACPATSMLHNYGATLGLAWVLWVCGAMRYRLAVRDVMLCSPGAACARAAGQARRAMPGLCSGAGGAGVSSRWMRHTGTLTEGRQFDQLPVRIWT